jgi:hypothetical protein
MIEQQLLLCFVRTVIPLDVPLLLLIRLDREQSAVVQTRTYRPHEKACRKSHSRAHDPYLRIFDRLQC